MKDIPEHIFFFTNSKIIDEAGTQIPILTVKPFTQFTGILSHVTITQENLLFQVCISPPLFITVNENIQQTSA